MGPGYAEVPLLVGGERPNNSDSFCPGEKEARRAEVLGVGGGEFSLSAMTIGSRTALSRNYRVLLAP